MKHFSYAFHSDELYLSKWDLVKLFFGWSPNLGGLKLNPKTHVIHQSEPEWEEADRKWRRGTP